MAGYKETPRQKMIAMMYLVLTALLALNVSKDILDAFIVVNQSMEQTNETFSDKLAGTYIKFENQYQLNQNKVEPFWNKAKEARQLANEMKEYIDDLKFQAVQVSERMDSLDIMEKYYHIETVPDPYDPRNEVQTAVLDIAHVPTKDKYDQATNFFINKGEAVKLKDKIIEFRESMLNLVDSAYRDDVKMGLDTDGPYYDADGSPQNWEMHHFYHTILAATVTILNKIKAEVQTAEFDIVSGLYEQITITDFKFDQVDAKIIPQTRYVRKGDKYEAEVLVAAYDSKQEPNVFVLPGADELTDNNINRAEKITGEDGSVKISFPATREGLQRYAGIIQIQDPSGDILSYPFADEYVVAPPSLTVAATKMNVFYIGVDNPVSISVPGIADAKIRASISTGSLTREPAGDGWIVRVPAGQSMAEINVSAMYEGEQRPMGTAEFRVKKVPDPVAKIAGQVEGQIERNTLLAAGAIIPVMEDFEFELYFRVTSFRMATVIGGDWISKRTNGNTFSEEMNSMIRSARRGQKFFFENIQAEGPDGVPRSLNPISLEID
jgi:gliding motility-associated protein GldM